MPKIIVTSRYMRNTPKRTAADLVRYMGTREGVKKLPEGFDSSPATVRQQRLIKEILNTVADAKEYPEYQSYLDKPTKGSATEFISVFIERNADRVGDMKKLVEYMAQRPGVEKLGGHGLFSQTDEKIDLNSVAEEVGAHEGIIWTHVVSLHREDAERLGYNNAAAWKDLVRRNVTELAQAHNISLDNLQWYAAFHDTAHHPHIHLMVYAKDAKQGWLSKKSIDDLRSTFGNDIFRQEQYMLFTMETRLRDQLKEEYKEALEKFVAESRDSYQPSIQVKMRYAQLCEGLQHYTGRKQYGYLPKELKGIVDQLVAELAQDKRVAKLYELWNEVNHKKLSLYHDKKKPDIPLERNKEFRSLKNMVIRAAEETLQREQEVSGQSLAVASSVLSLANAFLHMIADSHKQQLDQMNDQVDSKLRAKMNERKLRRGHKPDDHEYSGPTMSM